jgi:hypothetical protein
MAQDGLIRLEVSDTILNELGRVLDDKFEGRRRRLK